jgi:ABC-2 type transport system ATP-binding protein
MKRSVEVAELSKCYGRNPALTRLSFTADTGSIYGLIGPNGAGKTTVLSILAGLVSPNSGEASILGTKVKPNDPALTSAVGFATPQLSFFDYLTGAEVLLACGLMHGLRRGVAISRMRDLLTLLDLEPAAGQYLHQYSHGMRQKLGLACAMIHSPQVLLLDEPFLGLDPTSVYRLVHTLKRGSKNGRTIVLTSHDLSLVERLCDRVGILHEGTLKREIALGAASNQPAPPGTGLASSLWEVVGMPQFTELSWI